MHVRIGLVGDHDPSVTAHQAIPLALAQAGERLGITVAGCWLPTSAIGSADDCAGVDAFWCVPAIPYRSEEGALRAIRFARERRVPFLGTCGGFQHAFLEYARNVWHLTDATHAETDPDGVNPVIVPLSCSLVEARGTVRFVPGSRLHAIYGAPETTEGYHCRYGVRADLVRRLVNGPLQASAYDADHGLRAVELVDHPFFIATLFQPERRALRGERNPLVDAFVNAVAQRVGAMGPAPA
jgi:CTP synthase (UTP-ammonia lyase)